MIYFDVGAHIGQDSLNLGDDWTVYAFEPHPEFSKFLRESGGPNYHVIEKAVYNVPGRKVFNFCVEGGASSLLEFRSNDELARIWPGRPDILASGKSIEVDVITLGDFIESNGIGKIDYLHIDAQGVDLEVLQGLGRYAHIVEAGVIECCISDDRTIYKNQATIYDRCTNWLMTHGFDIVAINYNDPLHNELNIEFKKKVTRTAVCLSGLPRFVFSNAEHIIENLVAPNNADVFIHFWGQDKLSENIGFYKESFKRIEKLYQPKDIFLEEQRQFKNKAINFDRLYLRDEHNRDIAKICQDIHSQFYSMMKVNSIKEEYRLSNDIQYDYVIRARFDGLYSRPIIASQLDPSYIWTDKFDKRNQWPSSSMVEDWFAISSNQNMNIYTSGFLYLELFNQNALDERRLLTGETVIYELLNQFCLEHKFIPNLHFELRRT